MLPNVLGHVNNVMVKGDGVTVGGKPLTVATPTVAYVNTAGEIEVIEGDIPDSWQTSNTNIIGLVIGTGCVIVGANAFNGCNAITSKLVIPDSVRTIGNSAFRNAYGLTEVYFGSGLETIDDYAFYSESYFPMFTSATLTFPSSLKTIGEGVFMQTQADTLVFNEGLETIRDFAFDSSFPFVKGALVIPDSVTSIGTNAFSYTAITSLVTSATSIGDQAFIVCYSLSTISLNEGVETIGDDAFKFTGVVSVSTPSHTYISGLKCVSAMYQSGNG